MLPCALTMHSSLSNVAGTPVWDDRFDPTTPESQLALIAVCDAPFRWTQQQQQHLHLNHSSSGPSLSGGRGIRHGGSGGGGESMSPSRNPLRVAATLNCPMRDFRLFQHLRGQPFPVPLRPAPPPPAAPTPPPPLPSVTVTSTPTSPIENTPTSITSPASSLTSASPVRTRLLSFAKFWLGAKLGGYNLSANESGSHANASGRGSYTTPLSHGSEDGSSGSNSNSTEAVAHYEDFNTAFAEFVSVSASSRKNRWGYWLDPGS